MIASGPSAVAGVGDRDVVLADVDAVGVAGRRQARVVVDDEEGAVGVAEAAEGRAGALDRAAVELLLAQLHDVDAAVSAARSSGSGSSPWGRASQTK